ncbi:MAG: flagellar biosynthetic protein FliO [bacterium]
MFNYILGFSVYTLAMIGIIFVAFVVVKKCAVSRKGAKSHNSFLEIETSLSLEPRKTIHVVRAGNEKLLIATDAERTTFLTRLGDDSRQNVVYMKDYCEQAKIEKEVQEEEIIFDEQPKVFKDLMKRLQR